MEKICTLKALCFFACALIYCNVTIAQCGLSLSVTTTESRCKSTGSITATVTGGSGNYNYRITGAVPPIVTSTNKITGLPAGTYRIEVKDVVDGCTLVRETIVVAGNYQDPRFQLTATDVTCIGGSDGSITVAGQQYGTAPFSYSIIAPSPAGVGTTNTTGIFTNLVAGNYSVRLVDSCGGIQTRVITIADYNWFIDAHTVTKNGCNNADAVITLRDNRGNYNTSGAAFSGFVYGVSIAAGDTVWYPSRSFNFDKAKARSVTIIVKDPCGNIKSAVWNDTNKPTLGGSVAASNRACNTFTASIGGQANLTSANYCLYTSSNIFISCNASGTFNNLPYGAYQMRITDNCYDTTIIRNFNFPRLMPSIAAAVTVSNLGCTTFTASLTGTNLISPTYCLLDAGGNEIACQTTNGTFNNVPYGTYCIRITDACTNSTVTRCVTRVRPVPNEGATVTVTSRGCTTFNADVTGESSTTNIEYCIYDNDGNQIACNFTGQFNNLPYGTYCVRIKNDAACYDTTLIRCITVAPSMPSVGSTVNISNQTCTTFTASITTPLHLTNPQYCLYNSSNIQIACNSAGVFDNVPYGSYCIRARNDVSCYDTTIERCFTATQPIPSLSASVSISDRTCTGFTATMNASDLTSPQFCLYDSVNNQVACNSTGIFTNIPYGPYCIRVVNQCYDTTMQRCFTERPVLMNMQVAANASCVIGATDLVANWTATTGPFTINIYNPGNALVYTTTTSSSTSNINGLVGLPAGMEYKVVIRDHCNASDSLMVTPISSWFNKSINPNSKCPGSIWPNGSGDLQVSASYSQGTATPQIVRKNGSTVAINYSTVSGSNFTFINMEPATYVVEYTLQGCSTKQYDTFELRPYSFPDLQQSAVYQCNNNSFSVSAVVNGGLGPFSYEIIGSIPETPSIVAPPQSSAVFSIANNNEYGLVRLRAIDVCGNATTNDASVLPLANTTISASSNCYYDNILLSVDNIPNATYSWYKKTSATDSTLVGSGQSHNIPYLLPTDTGVYVCKVEVNAGCLTRLSTFNINGACSGLLPFGDLRFSGSLQGEAAVLQWATAASYTARSFVVERSADGVHYTAIGSVQAMPGAGRYYFTDQAPGAGNNFYRLQVVKPGGVIDWSTVVMLRRVGGTGWQVYPNPVLDHYKINFNNALPGQYSIVLMAADGRQMASQQVSVQRGEVKKLPRPTVARAGTYYLMVVHLASGERRIQPLIFK